MPGQSQGDPRAHGTRDHEETFSRYGHLVPGARDQARELVDAYLRGWTGLPAEEKDEPSQHVGKVEQEDEA
jgi:hypothetical protein